MQLLGNFPILESFFFTHYKDFFADDSKVSKKEQKKINKQKKKEIKKANKNKGKLPSNIKENRRENEEFDLN